MKKKDKNHKKLNINQLNNSTCDKTHVNNSNNNEERETLDQDDQKSESEEITEQINPNTLRNKRPCTIIDGDSKVKHLHGKSIANKTNSDNIIHVKLFLGARTKAMKHYVSPDLEKNRPNPLSTNLTKWSNTLKQFVGNLPTNCLSVFDHFVKFVLKGLNLLVHLKRSPMKLFH